MKRFVYLLFVTVLLCGCTNNTALQEEPSADSYDWEGLRDTLGLGPDCIFVKEVSPLYKDKDSLGLHLPPSSRLKTMFYEVGWDEYDCRHDTILWWVMRDNSIVWAGRNRQHSTVESWSWTDDMQELIEWCINNREKCFI
ncbi:MAG: hypothetical protein IJ557_08005 [Bacteroidaceae bacterium]|nr:hypothetical protein [Bacteroidaceae bacterium]